MDGSKTSLQARVLGPEMWKRAVPPPPFSIFLFSLLDDDDDDDDDDDRGGFRRCFERCMAQSGGNKALAALGVSSAAGGSIPSKRLFGAGTAGGGRSGRNWTTGPSMAATLIGGRRGRFGRVAGALRNFGRKVNPLGRISQAASGGFAAGVATSCAAGCAANKNFF